MVKHASQMHLRRGGYAAAAACERYVDMREAEADEGCQRGMQHAAQQAAQQAQAAAAAL